MDSTVRVVFLGNAASAVRSVNQLDRSFGSLGATARTAGKLIVGAFAGGVALGLAAAAKQAINFDRSMRNVNSIAKLSEKQFQALSKQVLGLAKVTGQGPKTLADGMYDIVSSGFKAKDAITILAASAKAATAGLTDTATSTKAVVAVLNAYHLSADQARKVSDVLFQEVNLGVNTFAELAQNIGDTAPQAAALNIPFAQVAAGLATITLHGTSMAEASTQMSRVLTSLVKPTTAMSAELEHMGYHTGQAAIQGLGFVGFIKRLSHDAGGNQAVLAKWLGDIRGIRGILNLTGKNLQSFTDNVHKMGQATEGVGATQKAFAEQAKSISFQWQRAKATLAAAAIPIGQLLFPALTKAAAALGDFAGWIDKINQAGDLHAKLDVIGGGFKDLAGTIEHSVGRILHGYDQVDQVRAKGPQLEPGHVKGLGEQIAGSLANVDWAMVGTHILNGIVAGIRGSVSFGKSVVDAISKAMGKVNWDAVAARIGPLLIVALGNAITSALDVGFWARHWDLALSLALVALGGSVGRIGGRLAELVGGTFGRAIASGTETAVLKVADVLGPRLGGAFLRAVEAAGHFAVAGFEKVGGLLAAIGSRIAARLGRVLTFTLKVLGVDAAIRAIVGWATAAAQAVWNGVKKIGDALAKIPGLLIAAFITGPIHLVEKALDAVKDVIEWLLHHASLSLAVHVSVPGLSLLERAASLAGKVAGGVTSAAGKVGGFVEHPFGLGRAMGGYIPGATGEAVPVLAHAGEIILNPQQQMVLGGPRFLSQLFGFTGERGAGAAFAAGGIVGGRPPDVPRISHSKPSPHSTLRTRRVRAANDRVRRALAALDTVNSQEADEDRTYGQMARYFDITQEQFLVDQQAQKIDESGNPVFRSDGKPDMETIQVVDPAAVAHRLGEIDQLVSERNKMLGLLDEEKADLQKAIANLKAAIKELLAAIKAEQDAAARDEAEARRLTARIADRNQTIEADRKTIRGNYQAIADDHRKISTESAKGKHANKQAIAGWRGDIFNLETQNRHLEGSVHGLIVDNAHDRTEARTRSHSATAHRGKAKTLQRELGDWRNSLADVRNNLAHVWPFDRRDVALDIDELQAERADVSGTTAPARVPVQGVGGTAGPDQSLIDFLMQELGQTRLALGIQKVQIPIIGSFARGTIHVSESGIAQVHAGERITPSGYPEPHGGDQPVELHLHLEGDLAALAPMIDARLESKGDAILVHLGTEADRRSREGRH